MDNQHRKIAGYRDLTQEELDLMNEVKAKGRELGELCARLGALAPKRGPHQELVTSTGAPVQVEHLPDGTEVLRSSDGSTFVDPRWLAIGQTHLQQGLMAVTRAIARPDFF